MFWWLDPFITGLVGMMPCHWVGDATHSRNHLLMLVCLEQRVKSSLAKRWAAEISSALHENLGERMWKKVFPIPALRSRFTHSHNSDYPGGDFFHFRLTHASCLVVLSLLNWPTLQNPGFNTRFQQDFGRVSIPTVPFFIVFLLMHVPLLQEAEKKNGPADQPEIALGI